MLKYLVLEKDVDSVDRIVKSAEKMYSNLDVHIDYSKAAKEFKAITIDGNQIIASFIPVKINCYSSSADTQGLESSIADMITSECLIYLTSIQKQYPVIILKYIVFCVNTFGYSNKRDSRPTGQRALEYYLYSKDIFSAPADYLDLIRSEFNQYNISVESNKIDISEMLHWIRSTDLSDDYHINLKSVCANPTIDIRRLWMFASLPHAYTVFNNHALNTETVKPNKFAGNIRDKVQFTGKCSCASQTNGKYGFRFKYKFIDNNNMVYVWDTAKQLKSGCSYNVTGTIKDCITYQGNSETVITRCKSMLVEE